MESNNIYFIYRSITDTESQIYKDLKDPDNHLIDGAYKSRILSTNPFIKDKNEIFQILACIDNTIVGSEIHFPIQLIMNNNNHYSITGSSLSVNIKYRKYGIGTKLTSKRIDYSDSNSVLLGNASQMHIPIQIKLGSAVFLMPRHIYLKSSKPVLEMYIKHKKLLSIFSKVSDTILHMYNLVIENKATKSINRFQIIKHSSVPQEIEDIINMDPHPYKENHNREWFEWILNNSFSKNAESKQSLYTINNKDEIIGFFMTKERFYKQASHRGFKDVLLGSVIEWGSKDQKLISEEDILKYSITTFSKNISAIEICTDNKHISNRLKTLGFIKVGEANAILRIGENSPLLQYEDIRDQTKWRIRPSMGDSALS